ncbi:MAG TPA: hypothetical protein VEB66_12210 [Opitutaceae bacterium]|nr:hypothetical protein [Opitutaceae bacterium]
MAKKVKPSLGCGFALFVLLLVLGSGLLSIPVRLAVAGRGVDAGAVVAGLFGLAVLVGAFAYMRFARREVARHEDNERIAAANPGRPWLLKPEWRAGAIESKEGRGTAFLWFFALVWNGISGAATWAMLAGGQPRKGEYFVLLFPFVGAFLLWAAVHQAIKWRKFGRARFVPSSLPGVIGGYLGGVIEVPARLDLEADAKVALRCVRRVTRGSGKNRHTSESVVWEREELVARDQWLGAAGRTDIPVLFYIPPECEPWNDEDSDNQLVWRLSASAAVPGVDFSASFEVPVFATGETAAPPDPGRPVLAEYRSGPADAATLARAGVKDLADGFDFSSGHLAGTRAVVTCLMLGLVALCVVMVVQGANFVAVAFAAVFTALTALFAFDLWSDRFEVRIAGSDVVVTQRRPWGARVTRVPRSDVAEVRAHSSMSSGESRYYRLTLVGRPGVDPRQPAVAEHFAARKLRHRLKRLAKELGAHDPTKLGERGAAILAEMERTPAFELVIAKHVAGQATAEAVGAAVLARIQAG